MNLIWMVMVLYLYSTFLVLMTTLQYSFLHSPIHTHIHTVQLLAALCCSMRANSGFSILPKDTSACRWGKLGIELPTFKAIMLLRFDGEEQMGTPSPGWNALSDHVDFSNYSSACWRAEGLPLAVIRPLTTSFPHDVISRISHFRTSKFLFHYLYQNTATLRPKHN